jgi:hypothetical protein
MRLDAELLLLGTATDAEGWVLRVVLIDHQPNSERR